jgi:hypothetical protein
MAQTAAGALARMATEAVIGMLPGGGEENSGSERDGEGEGGNRGGREGRGRKS